MPKISRITSPLHNSYQKRTPCLIIFTVNEHPVERLIPSSQVWKSPPPGHIVPAISFVFKFCRHVTVPGIILCLHRADM